MLWRPARLVQFEHWAGHIPFAFWMIKCLRPRLLVELGTHRGNSYCAFCQAIASLQLDTKAFAIDTWEGDLHIGREQGVLEDLKEHHDRLYGSFSSLMQMQFDEARGFFAPETVDLLHIDGTHTYEAVRKDFENWLPTLSSRGVVLFHDTNVRQEHYGVWQLWREVSTQYPSFEFTHSHGLGMLCVGTDLPDPIRSLDEISADPDLASHARELFAVHGEALILQVLAAAKRVSLTNAQNEIVELTAKLETRDSEATTWGAKLAAQAAIATELKANLATRDAETTTLGAKLAAQEAMATELKAKLATRDAETTMLEEKLAAQEAMAEARLAGIYASRSWRITAPLRAISRGLRWLALNTGRARALLNTGTEVKTSAVAAEQVFGLRAIAG